MKYAFITKKFTNESLKFELQGIFFRRKVLIDFGDTGVFEAIAARVFLVYFMEFHTGSLNQR